MSTAVDWHNASAVTSALAESLQQGSFGLMRSRHAMFRGAAPYSHAVLDDLFPDALLDAVDEQFPDPAEPTSTVDACKDAARRRGRHWHCTAHGAGNGGHLKIGTGDENGMRDAPRALMRFFKGRDFVRHLEMMTGIGPLIVDEMNVGAGYASRAAHGHTPHACPLGCAHSMRRCVPHFLALTLLDLGRVHHSSRARHRQPTGCIRSSPTAHSKSTPTSTATRRRATSGGSTSSYTSTVPGARAGVASWSCGIRTSRRAPSASRLGKTGWLSSRPRIIHIVRFRQRLELSMRPAVGASSLWTLVRRYSFYPPPSFPGC